MALSISDSAAREIRKLAADMTLENGGTRVLLSDAILKAIQVYKESKTIRIQPGGPRIEY